MLSQQDLSQIALKGITEEQINTQLKEFETGFPFLKLEAAASIGHGIISPDKAEQDAYVEAWRQYKAAGRKKFAFYDALNAKCIENEGKDIKALMAEGNYKAVAANMLNKEGLNYGQLPKGLLLFHKYDSGARTPIEEHLVEGALYADSNAEANMHFTVSPEHRVVFEAKVAEKKGMYEEKFGIKYNVSFSEQKSNTDTIAANPDNTPFRNEDGSLLFRPGGHHDHPF